MGRLFPSVTVGQYLPGDGALHRLDPRTKLLGTIAYLAVLLAIRGPWALGACAAFTTMSYAVAHPPLGALWRGNRMIAGLLALTIASNILLFPGTVVYHLGPIPITREGLTIGLTAGVRLALLVVQSNLVTLTTAPLDLCAGAERLLGPFRRLGVPAHELALMAGLALRFIPTLAEESERITRAQAARGADLRGSNLAGRLRAGVAMLVPLLLSVFRRADQLAMAMEARGYRGEQGRTRYRQSRLERADAVAATLVAALAVFALWASFRQV